MIHNHEITFVVQGPHNRGDIKQVVDSITRFCSGAKIIISTWEGENFKYPELVDEVIYNKDPGDLSPGHIINNANRQLVSTLNGLNAVRTKYAFKLRSDFYLKGDKFKSFFDQFNQFEDEYKIVSKRVIASSFISKNPRAYKKENGKSVVTPFHLGDLAFFGLTVDLINIFDIPLLSQESRFLYATEQYILISFLKKNGKTINMKNCYDVGENGENVILTDKYIVNNFVIAPHTSMCVEQFSRNLEPFTKFNVYLMCYNYRDWLQLYKDNCDAGYEIEFEQPDFRLMKKHFILSRLVAKAFSIFYKKQKKRIFRNSIISKYMELKFKNAEL